MCGLTRSRIRMLASKPASDCLFVTMCGRRTGSLGVWRTNTPTWKRAGSTGSSSKGPTRGSLLGVALAFGSSVQPLARPGLRWHPSPILRSY